eukprot:CAMPEP_0172167462 /NCGR_PEP_ID=MMETSP1050-20130122/9590_1 /TAXON_ID=233186 /ORGANISM="Cryptomonas curvata, Strain CCAP979/52" /LENGTH=180 /DNA_ID=CAMNT_0012838265 /DNA_START=23 /DNA_END=562 /DNA_ORIENTATION=+
MERDLESRGENAAEVPMESHEMTGVDWHSDVSKRRKNFNTGSMPNVLASGEVKSDPPANSFSRTASSAEDDVVGALRTRVMNASFIRRRSDSALNSVQAKRETRRASMPTLSRTMPTSMMKKIVNEMNLETCEVAQRGMAEAVDVSSILDQIMEEGDENNAEILTRLMHIQWVCAQLGLD